MLAEYFRFSSSEDNSLGQGSIQIFLSSTMTTDLNLMYIKKKT